MRKVKVLVLALILVFTMSCVVGAGSLKSYVDPDGEKYLGTAYNSITNSFIYDNVAVEKNGALVEDINYSYSHYKLIKSKRELKELFNSNFTAGASIDLGFFSAKTELTKTIEKSYSFNSETLYIIAFWKEIDKNIYFNGLPQIKDEAISVLNNDAKRFQKIYGDKYVNGVVTGKMFYIVYRADISKVSNSKIVNVEKAFKLSVKKILSGNVSSSEETFIENNMENVIIESFTHAYGINGLTGIYSHEQLNKMIDNIKTNAKSAVLARELKNYSHTANGYGQSFIDVSKYIEMADEWQKYYEYLDYIKSNDRVNYGLKNSCGSEMNKIKEQYNLVTELNKNARSPYNSEVSSYESLFNEYLDLLNIRSRWYEMPSITKEFRASRLLFDSFIGKEAYIDFSNFDKINKIKIEIKVDNLFKKAKASLYANDNGFYEYDSKNLPIDKRTVLYEGNNFVDELKVKVTGESNAIFSNIEFTVYPSYQPRINDEIWLYMNGYNNI